MPQAAVSIAQDRTARVREGCRGAIAELVGAVLPHGSAHADYACGVLSYLAADLGEAATSLERAQARAPSARTAYTLGLAHAASNHWAEASTAFLDGVAIAPDLLEGYYQAAGALRRQGRGAEAAALLRQAVERFRGTSWAPYLLNELGVGLQVDGDDEGAMACFRQAIAMPGADRVAARANLALVLERNGRGDEARQVLEEVLAETERRGAPHSLPRISFLVCYLLGNLELAAARPLRACRWYERSLEFLPDSATAWNSLAIAMHAAGRRRKAAGALRRALASDPGFSAARRNLEALNATQRSIR